jgi:regulator of cell morphogenesis and NO signaling
MTIDATKTVKEIVVEAPSSVRVFESLGIDYCCGADKPLGDACRNAGRPVDEVLQSLEEAERSPGPESPVTNWNQESLANLADHIVAKHHSFCRQEVSRLSPLVRKVVEKHGSNHPELRRIGTLFAGLSNELLMHLVKEEQMLFPYISRLEQAVTNHTSFPRPPFGTVQNPVRMMVLEHDQAGEQLKEIHELSNGYEPPSDACGSFKALYQGLKFFEEDMHQHVHLENNVLFPRAVAIEDRAYSSAGTAGS